MAELEKTAGVDWGREVMASVVVFLVALPLCMGIAISSGVPPALGLISGIVGGILVGLIAGAPLQVSGPAAGLAVIVWDMVNKFGLKALGVIVLLAGAIQLVAGWYRLGRWFRAVSPAVIHGMLAGIGVLIFASQFHVLVDDKPRKNGLLNLLSIPESIYLGLFSGGSPHRSAALVGVSTIAVIVLWNVLKPKRLALFPGPFVGALFAAVLAGGLGLPVKFLEVPASLWGATNVPGGSEWWLLLQPRVWGAALVLALVASAETLLSVAATDRMHMGPRAQYDKELRAQGIGNMVCGLLGALPITGVIVRSSANVAAGAQTRWSAVIHGLWLLVLILFFPWLLNLIPTSALAAVLVLTGYKLMNFKGAVELWKTSRSEAGIYALTVALIVGVDLLTGVIVGITLSLLKLVYAFTNLDVDVKRQEDGSTDIHLLGAATFVRLPVLAEELEKLPLDARVRVHLERLNYVDHACIELLDNWAQQLEKSGGQLQVEWSMLRGKFRHNPYEGDDQQQPPDAPQQEEQPDASGQSEQPDAPQQGEKS